jgi:hypothetical protein
MYKGTEFRDSIIRKKGTVSRDFSLRDGILPTNSVYVLLPHWIILSTTPQLVQSGQHSHPQAFTHHRSPMFPLTLSIAPLSRPYFLPCLFLISVDYSIIPMLKTLEEWHINKNSVSNRFFLLK